MQSVLVAIGRQSVITILKFYRWVVSPMLLMIFGPACRFEPSCSAYALVAVSQYGIARGGWMALRRIIECRPGGGWGYDPPIDRPSSSSSSNKLR